MHEARIRARTPVLPRAFVDELRRIDADDVAAYAAVAGLVVLRVVDRWVAEGCREAFEVTGARNAVLEMDAGNPARAILERVLDATAAGGANASAAVANELLMYGRALELDAKWSQAVAVYEAIVSHADVGSPAVAVVVAHLRQGYCFRYLGDVAQSREHYRQAHRLAKAIDYLAGELRAESGLAKTDALEGRPDAADVAFERIIGRARQAGEIQVEARALHERAAIAGEGGDPLTAAKFAYAALKLTTLPSDRDRILNDIGESLRRLGARDAARDAFLVLSCTARDQVSRWMALAHLMRIAGDDGAPDSYREYRRLLETAPLAPRLEIEMDMQSGYALRSLGEPSASRAAFRRAASLARRHGFTRELQEAEQAAAGGADCVAQPLAAAQDLDEIAAALRVLRESTAAT